MDLKTYISQNESGADLSRRLKVPATLISQWKTGVRRVPAERCPDIERETNGVVTCEEMRPDVDWAYLRRARCDKQAA